MARDLISRYDALESLWNEKAYKDSFAYRRAIINLVNAPAVDAVEVVRCKDCKHFDDGECTMMSEPKERREYERWVTIVAEDDFCSCGERRKEDAVD